MTLDQALEEVLDETVKALSNMDPARLHGLEQRIIALTTSNAKFDKCRIELIRQKKRRLEIILQNFQVNLDALMRLNARNMRNQWVR